MTQKEVFKKYKFEKELELKNNEQQLKILQHENEKLKLDNNKKELQFNKHSKNLKNEQ